MRWLRLRPFHERLGLATEDPEFKLLLPSGKITEKVRILYLPLFGLLDPGGCLIVPMSRLLGAARALVGHGQEKPIQRSTPLAVGLHRLLQPFDRVVVSAGAVKHSPERIEAPALPRRLRNRLLGESNRL